MLSSSRYRRILLTSTVFLGVSVEIVIYVLCAVGRQVVPDLRWRRLADVVSCLQNAVRLLFGVTLLLNLEGYDGSLS